MSLSYGSILNFPTFTEFLSLLIIYKDIALYKTDSV